ncbi:M48 family metalloprotease [Sphingomonas qilianensis]|uniref:M48 family metalloprotease n=1 Tax=Sphingomonas qilianensis TaxID=1736690 RepID=A0ABU9XMW6_9SPHN
MTFWLRASCAAVCLVSTVQAVAKDAIPAVPPYVAAYQPQGVDERGVWMIADEAERSLRDSKTLIGDTALNAYLRDVLCRTVGADRCGGVRLYVVRQALFNAFMTPNGTMVVYSGLLLRVRDEAELAAVLGHEFAHFELRHTLRGFQHTRSATDIGAWAGLLAAGARTYGTAQSYQMIQLSAIGSIFSFNRDQERQADLLSMAYLKASPYDPRCFADIWLRLMDEADATARGRRQRSKRYDRTAFFATHPPTLERATYLRDLATVMNKPGEDDAPRYDAKLAAWRRQFLADQLKLNDFEGTDYLLGELARSGWTADLLFARGELYRARGNPRDLVAAASFYRDAIGQDPANAEAYRGLGLAQLRSRDPAGGDALRKYLAMRPDAPDGAMISTLVQ